MHASLVLCSPAYACSFFLSTPAGITQQCFDVSVVPASVAHVLMRACAKSTSKINFAKLKVQVRVLVAESVPADRRERMHDALNKLMDGAYRITSIHHQNHYVFIQCAHRSDA
jgi:hypothetical protein